MQQLVTFTIVGGSIAGSLAFGVLLARMVCRSAFAIFKAHAISAANQRLQKASAAS